MKILLLFSFLFCAACASNHVTLLQAGKTRPAIAASSVKLYLKPPAHYEAIGEMSASDSSHVMSKQGLQDELVGEMKEKAASVGANGLLITGTGAGQVPGPYFASGPIGAADEQIVHATAIYVP